MDVLVSAALTAAGLVMLCFGGHWLVSGSASIAKRYHVSNLIIGMTIVAYGTSTPELAATIAAAGQHGGIILGNVVGSNIANIGMVLAVTAILAPLAVGRSLFRKEVPIMLGSSLLLVVLSIDGEVSWYDGIALLACLAAFATYTFWNIVRRRTAGNGRGDASQAQADPAQAGGATAKHLLLIGVGLALLYAGAVFTVDHAVILAEAFGLSEVVISITVVAIGTSLPELITSAVAIRQGHARMGLGNVVGSNIYNVLLIMGVGASLGGIAVEAGIYLDYAVMVAFGLSIFVALKTGMLGRLVGAGMAAAYAAYLILMFFR